MIPVNVIGYSGLTAGVESDELKAGMMVVVEGNERLQDKQAVAYPATDSGRQQVQDEEQVTEDRSQKAAS
jgi:hypothetical protein